MLDIMPPNFYTPNLQIETADRPLMPYTSIGMTALLHMPWDPDQHSTFDIYPAMPGPSTKILLWSIAFHIRQAAALRSIYSFVLRPESNEHTELENSQYKSLCPTRHWDIHLRIASGVEPAILAFVSQIHESRMVDDPMMFRFRIAVLAFTSSLESNQNVLRVRSSVLSQTITARARLYTLQ
jgi:hypothetical protein